MAWKPATSLLQRSHVWPLCWHNHVEAPDVWIAVLMALQTFCSLKKDNNICIKSKRNKHEKNEKETADIKNDLELF